ncbi:MAG: LuxR C-terminal-related transcriptional regulator [Gammaproteobacteria bacterium]|nr:LuxR C-terminal-related transcriptional regulator [Gammaproteobacteria bacterium]
MIADVIIFILSNVVLLLLMFDYLEQQKSLHSMQEQLVAARGRLQQFDESALEVAKKYRNIMQNQFDQWALTSTEQQIALMLIKGLSFREVAEIRKTMEKSVRQQATKIYKKAGVTGRHELAGWFFEDLLSPR